MGTMKFLRRGRNGLLCMFLLITLMCNVASASTFYWRDKEVGPGSHGFSHEWNEVTDLEWETTCGGVPFTIGSPITYGYDTFLTNEDYVKRVGGQPTGWGVYGYVTNSQGTTEETAMIWGNSVGGSADVKHTGSNVHYGVWIKMVFI